MGNVCNCNYVFVVFKRIDLADPPLPVTTSTGISVSTTKGEVGAMGEG